jgi:Cdc6-like AAA superfamily ATPase
MSASLDEILTFGESVVLAAEAAKVFRPRTPITSKELFAGRWNELKAVADAVNQPGLHTVIYGERGVGKTSLANVISPTIRVLDRSGKQESEVSERLIVKTVTTTGDSFSSIWGKLFGEVSMIDNRPTIGLIPNSRERIPLLDAYGLKHPLSIDDVRRILVNIPGSVFIIDEFDRASDEASRAITDLIKTLSDFGIDSTVVLVGVSDTIDRLISDHASIVRAISQIFMRRMTPEELKIILTNAENALTVKFSDEASSLTVHISQGLPHYTHLIGLNAVRVAVATNFSRRIERGDVFKALEEATKQAEQTAREKHSKATHSSHKDALYRQVLLACAVAVARSDDALGYFNPASVAEPLSQILHRHVEIATFNSHLSEFCQGKRGPVLERDGQPRAYRFRFNDPMVVPFVFMDAVTKNTVSQDQLSQMLTSY